MAGAADDAVTTARDAPDWTHDFFGALTSLGSVYLQGKYGQNDEQYVKGADGVLYPAGQPIANQVQPQTSMNMMPMLLVGGALLVVVLLVAD